MSRRHALPALCAVLALPACRDRPDGAGLATDPHAPAPRASLAAVRATPRVPGRPRPVAAPLGAAADEAQQTARHLGLHDAPAAIAALGRARTTLELNHLAVGALAALHGERGPAASALRRELAGAYNRAAPNVRQIAVPHAAGVGACRVDFDDPAILASFADEQALFSSPPHWVQPCGNGDVHVEPVRQDHMHLEFEDRSIDCLDLESGLFGRSGSGGCAPLQPADALQEPRYVGSHDGADVIRIRRRVGGVASTFTLHSFVVVGSTPIKLRYRTAGGPWFQWDRMAGNTMWDVSAYLAGVTEVQITHPDGSFSCNSGGLTADPPSCPSGATPVFIDDLSISPPPIFVPRSR